MSHDASPSSTARTDTPPVEPLPASSANRITRDLLSPEQPRSRSRAQSHSQRRKKKKSRKRRNPGLARKLEFITHLLKSLDTLVFAELSALYYMEYVLIRPCLLARLALTNVYL